MYNGWVVVCPSTLNLTGNHPKHFMIVLPISSLRLIFTAGKLEVENVQLTFGENINSGMLQKLYWIYIFWDPQPISYTLK